MRRACLLLLLPLLLSACPDTPSEDDDDAGETPPPGAGVEDSLYSGDWAVPDRSAFDVLELPPGPGGAGYSLVRTPDTSLIMDPERRTPLSAAAECVALIVACYEPGVRTRRGCFDNVAVCPDDTPWDGDEPYCCPASCAAIYVQHRNAGLNQPDAVVATVLRDGSCAPGLDDWRRSTR